MDERRRSPETPSSLLHRQPVFLFLDDFLGAIWTDDISPARIGNSSPHGSPWCGLAIYKDHLLSSPTA
jgi:hypothetical protein